MIKRMVIAALLLFVSGEALAQEVPFQATEAYRAYQLDRLEADRALYLAMVDSMSDEAFMEGGMHGFAMRTRRIVRRINFSHVRLAGGHGPALPTAAEAMMRDGLKEYINGVYDYGAELLMSQSEEKRLATVDLFSTRLPMWRVWDALHEQALWNAGQLVHFFRDRNLVYPTPPLTSDAAPAAEEPPSGTTH